MARVTFVKKARQRYETVPVLDGSGQQIEVPTTRRTKSGRLVVIKLTREDKDKPLPNRTCGRCGKEIEVGQPYKWIAPRSGPYGGRKLYRCGPCPTWHVWEYSSSLSARIEEIVYNFEQTAAEVVCADDIASAGSEAATLIREIAEEKRESAQNIEDGFGHSTAQSDELNDIADQLDSWADEVENFTADDPEPDETDCEDCDGDDENCSTCEGTGVFTPDEPTDDQISDWRDSALDGHPINDCPV